MSKVDDGGPAFPQPTSGDHYLVPDLTGASLRDYFAAHCPIAFGEFLVGWKGTANASTEQALKRYAEFRFKYADAMVTARAESEAP